MAPGALGTCSHSQNDPAGTVTATVAGIFKIVVKPMWTLLCTLPFLKLNLEIWAALA
jgi:hypothetical protein